MGSLFNKPIKIELDPNTENSCFSKCCNATEQEKEKITPELKAILMPYDSSRNCYIEQKLTQHINDQLHLK